MKNLRHHQQWHQKWNPLVAKTNEGRFACLEAAVNLNSKQIETQNLVAKMKVSALATHLLIIDQRLRLIAMGAKEALQMRHGHGTVKEGKKTSARDSNRLDVVFFQTRSSIDEWDFSSPSRLVERVFWVSLCVIRLSKTVLKKKRILEFRFWIHDFRFVTSDLSDLQCASHRIWKLYSKIDSLFVLGCFFVTAATAPGARL